MKSYKSAITIVLFTFAAFLSSCVSTTMINSEPQGARVFVNDEYKGMTPYSYSDEKIIFMRTAIRLEKDGFEPFSTYIERSERPDAGPIVAGFFTSGVTWLWGLRYNESHSYILKPLPEAPSDKAVNQTISPDKYQKLIELKKLFDEGLISQEEYDKLRQKVLDEK